MNIDYGIKRFFENKDFEKENVFRIISRTNNYFILANSNEEIKISIATKDDDYMVGDFVQVENFDSQYFITRRFERRSIITKASNTTKKSYSFNDQEQVLVSNVDQIFIMIAADQRFTLSKFERYLLTFNTMANDIKILISKSDIKDRAEEIEREIDSVYPEIKVYKISIYDNTSIEKAISLFSKGQTAILVGSSGAGKSSLINHLFEGYNFLLTQDVRSDGKGKHTTTSSMIYYIPTTKSYIADSPGFKNISTYRETSDDILFKQINELSEKCKFNDCKHKTEPGCAVNKAIEEGELSKDLYERYLKNKDREFRIRRFEEKKEKKKLLKK